MSDKAFVTLSQLAKRCGVTHVAVRWWIKTGRIAEPMVEPVSGLRGYTAEATRRIARWYLQKAAKRGGTRGAGASTRRARAQAALAEPTNQAN
jgi:hypothetical protein